MTLAELNILLEKGESLTLEFKRDAPISDNELAEAISCLANAEGGWLLLGVENNGSISGLHPKHQPVNIHLLEAMIANKTNPSVRVEPFTVQTDLGIVVAFRVSKSPHLVWLTDGRTLQRYIVGQGKPECRVMQPHEIASRLTELHQYDYTAQPVHTAQWSDLNPLEFERLRQTIQRNARSDKTLLGLPDSELAKALGLVASSGDTLTPTVVGLLLAGHETAIRNYIPTHEVAFQILQEDRKLSFNEFYREPLVKTFERLEQLLQAYNPEEELSFGIYRIGVPVYPAEAFREVLANALVHRSYILLNAVYVRIDPDARGLVISSPGGLVDGVTLENLLVIERIQGIEFSRTLLSD